MFGIMKKNMLFFVQYIGALYPFMILYWLFKRNAFDLPALMLTGFFFYLLVAGSVSVMENYENKNNAYLFLKTLPVNANEIVKAKLYNVLLAVLFLFTGNIIIYLIIIKNPAMLISSIVFIICCALVTLNIIAALYVGFFSVGFNKMGKLLWITMILWMMMTILSVELYLINLDANVLYKSISDINRLVWVAVTAAGLAVYYGLMRIAVRKLDQYYNNV